MSMREIPSGTDATSAGAGRPVISVAVSTYNRVDRLGRLVEALAAQDLDAAFEVVISDDGSTDDTWSELGRLADAHGQWLRPLRIEVNQGAAHGRNAAWRAARAPIIAFTDDDCRPDPGWLRGLVAALADDVDVVQGCTRPDPLHEHRRGPFSHTIEMTSERGWYETCNIAYRRALLERVDGLDESWECTTGEDTDLAYRAKAVGARTAFADDAVVYHEITPSDVRASFRSARRWDEVPRLVARHPHLRTSLYYSRWFWRSSHPKALEALAAIAVAASPTRSPAGRLARLGVAAMLAHPYWHFRTEIEPLWAGPRRRRALIPVAWAIDMAEVAVLARGSVRHRSLYL